MQDAFNKDNSLQVTSVVSKKKYLIVKLYDKIAKCSVRIKYLNIQDWAQAKRTFFINSLISINASELCKTTIFHKSITYGAFNSHLCITDKFIQSRSLSQIFINSEKNNSEGKNFNRELSLKAFLQISRFYLLDCFMQTININTLILTEEALFIEPKQFIANKISFTGIDLIIFQKEISAQQFKQIQNYLDPQIFQRKPHERIGHQQKIWNFAVILLTFVVNSPIRLFQNQHIPDVINIQKAKRIIQKSPLLFKKFLETSYIKKKIKIKQNQWGIQLLDFFKSILVEKINKSWGQIKYQLTKPPLSQIIFQDQFKQNARQTWNKLPKGLKDYFISKRIVSSPQLDEHQQLFMIVMLKQKMSSLWEGSLLNELGLRKDNDGYNIQTIRIISSYMQLIVNNFVKDESYRQSAESIQLCEDNSQVLNEQFHRKIFQLVENKLLNQENEIQANVKFYEEMSTLFQETINFTADREQDFEEQSQKYPVYFQPHVSHSLNSSNQKPISAMMDELCKIMKNKMTVCQVIKGRNIKMENQRLKTLNEFKQALR